MVPVEVTAFGLLAVCVIALAAVLAFQLVPPPATPPARLLMLVVLAVVVVLAIAVLATTRTR